MILIIIWPTFPISQFSIILIGYINTLYIFIYIYLFIGLFVYVCYREKMWKRFVDDAIDSINNAAERNANST